MTSHATADSDFYRLSADGGPVWWLRGDPRSVPAWHPIGYPSSLRDPLSRGPDMAGKEGKRSAVAIEIHRMYAPLFVRARRLMLVTARFRDELAQIMAVVLSRRDRGEPSTRRTPETA
jgi:hypothetical protein